MPSVDRALTVLKLTVRGGGRPAPPPSSILQSVQFD